MMDYSFKREEDEFGFGSDWGVECQSKLDMMIHLIRSIDRETRPAPSKVANPHPSHVFFMSSSGYHSN